MQVVVKKWGNSAAVRIPAAVLEAAQVRGAGRSGEKPGLARPKATRKGRVNAADLAELRAKLAALIM